MNVNIGLCHRFNKKRRLHFRVVLACNTSLRRRRVYFVRLLPETALFVRAVDEDWAFETPTAKPRDKENQHRPTYIEHLKKLARIFGAHDVGMYHHPINTFRSLLVHPKDKTPDLQKCGVWYQITCPQCQHLYVGETGRTRATRMKDHTSHNSQPTAVGDLCQDHGHVISKNNVEVLAREEGWLKRKVREAIKIKTIQPIINRDQGFDLPAIYTEILPVTRDCSRQTSNHPALTNRAVSGRSLTK